MINFDLKTNAFLKKHWGPQRPLDFPRFSILRYVGVFSVRLLMIGVYFLSFSFIFFTSIVVYLKLGSRLTFFDIFLHFLQKHRCVRTIRFSADILMDISMFLLFSYEVSLCTWNWVLSWHFYWHFDWHVYWNFYSPFYWHVHWNLYWHFLIFSLTCWLTFLLTFFSKFLLAFLLTCWLKCWLTRREEEARKERTFS